MQKNTIQNIIQKSLIILVVAFVVVGFGCLTVKAIDKQESIDCLKWQKEATQYPSYFLKQWQSDQCKAHDIVINAEIK
jgi:hypothetical protein